MRARPQTVELIRGYYELIDTGRLDETARYLTPDATIRIANYPPMSGCEQILGSMRAGLGIARSIRHELKAAWEEDDGVVIFVVHAHYDLHDGRRVVVPGTVVAKVDGDRFREQHIYADLTAVYGQGR